MSCNDDWLEIEILSGLQKLSCLSLDRTPAAEVLLGTVQAWLEAITDGRTWDERRDAGRVQAAFRTLGRTMRRWPSPAEFLDALPRVEQTAIGYEVKPVTHEEAAANIARLKAMLGEVVEPMPPAKPERETSAEERERIEADLRRHYDRKTAAAGGDS